MSDASPLLRQFVMDNALSAKHGQAYEDFFSSFGGAMWGAEFEQWKPQGQIGDFKCDGYLVPEKAVFQCYAPERLEAAKTGAKIQDSFYGALEHFDGRMEKWCFVHNSRSGLHATSSMLIAELREKHPDITIEVWGPDEILRQSQQDPGVSRQLFPELLSGSQLDRATEDALLDHARTIIAARNAEGSEPAGGNEPTLDAILEQLSEQDREMRRRIMGLTKWLDPAPIDRIVAELVERGFLIPNIRTNITRLCEAEIVLATSQHLLPLDEEMCQQAADTMTTEMIGRLQ